MKRKALGYGAQDLQVSNRKYKKFKVQYNGSWIHFGDSRYSDYTQHKDDDRRRRYRARHKAIMKDGRPAYLNKKSPAFWSYHLLW